MEEKLGEGGFAEADQATAAVHRIDVWYAHSRRRWMVERYDGDGDPIGAAHQCRTRADAEACLHDWLRRHPETHHTEASDRGRA